MKASGQKNTASLGYYFGSKEKLIRELIIEGAKIIDDRRNAALDELEAAGGPKCVRDITDILVFTAVRMSDDHPAHEDCYSRFITHIGQNHPELFFDTLGDKWAQGLTRCFRHLRRLMPEMPSAVETQRIQFITEYLGAVLSSRERALTGNAAHAGLWPFDGALHHFSQTMAAIIEAPFDDNAFDKAILDDVREDDRATALMGGTGT